MSAFTPVSFVSDSFPVSLVQVEHILKKIDDSITLKEIDKKRGGFSVITTLSLCMKNSIASVFRADPKGDD
jgi:hypothetical protein